MTDSQIGLFDSVYLGFMDCFLNEASQASPKKRVRKTKPKEESSASLLDSLLPYLFPEDYPELQQQIDSTQITWSDEDIDILEREILFSSINVLLDYRSGVQSRDEAYAWMMNDDVAPFSYRACVSSMGGRAEPFRTMVYARMALERSRLRRSATLTKRQLAYRDWIDQLAIPETDFDSNTMTGIELLAWIDELDTMHQTAVSRSGY